MEKFQCNPLRGRDWLKIFLCKGIFILLFLTVYLPVSGSVYSSKTKLNITAGKVSVTEVLKKIEEQSEFHFLYRSDHLKGIMVDEINVKETKLEEILDKVLVSKGFTYEIDDRTVVIRKAEQVQNQQVQRRTIRGTVRDENGQPLPGVSVMVTGTTIGQFTDTNGNYTLEVPNDAKSLEFSFVGMERQVIAISGRNVVDISMKEEISGLEEVVVVGYGTQKKVNLTGAVDVVTQDKLQDRPTANLGGLLQGLAPNLNISTTQFGGEPGAPFSFNIRGIGSLEGDDAPLILVDGIEMNINNLDPETVESVSVLKDAASAAIYGSRAPFGVVLITTKKGTKNQGIKVSYSNNTAFSSPIHLPKWQSSIRYVTAYNQALRNTGLPDKFGPEQIDRIERYIAGTYTPEYDTINPPASIWAGRHEGNANYEWFDEYFKDVTVNQKHNINITGGDENTQFYISTGLYDQGGSYNWAKEYYRRYNVSANVSTQATSWLKFNLNSKYANTKSIHPSLGDWDPARNFIISEMIKFFPTTTFYNVNGTINNPYVLALQQAGPATGNENDILITLGSEIEPIQGWKTNINYSYNYTGIADSWVNPSLFAELPTGEVVDYWDPNAYGQNWQSNHYKSFNAFTAYEKTIGGHYFKGMVGYEREYRYFSSMYGKRYGLVSSEVPSFSTSSGVSELDDSKSDWATEAFFGRLNYNYKEKYLIEVNGRYNGSSKFAEDSRWGFFPSVSVGYNIAREAFWEPLQDKVNNLKLRVSYGSLGNQNVPNYRFISSIPIYNNLEWILDGQRPLYAWSPDPAIISPTLTWETVNTLNFGLDASFLNNRLGFTFDWYNRNTKDMFGPAQVLPNSLGATPPRENNASLSTKGWEIVLDWNDRINSDLIYSLRLSLADNKTKVTEYLNETGLIDQFYVGKEIGEIWGYTTYGLIQTADEAASMPDQTYLYSEWRPGDVRYTDLNGDNKIDDGDRTLDSHGDLSVIGNTSPRYSLGFNASVKWKNFDFSMFWQGVLKRDLVPGGNLFWGIGTRGDSGGAFYAGHEDYWRPADETNIFGPNTDAYYPIPYITFSAQTSKNQQVQSRYTLNAGYLRLKNIQLGYTIPQSITSKLRIQALKVYVSGENLITFDDLPTYINPETAFTGSGSFMASYPMSKSVSLGLNLTF